MQNWASLYNMHPGQKLESRVHEVKTEESAWRGGSSGITCLYPVDAFAGHGCLGGRMWHGDAVGAGRLCGSWLEPGGWQQHTKVVARFCGGTACRT